MFKVLFTVAMVYGVWFVFKHWNRITAAHKVVMDEKRREAADQAARAPRTPVAQDLVPCPKCGSYIAAGSPCSCEKA